MDLVHEKWQSRFVEECFVAIAAPIVCTARKSYYEALLICKRHVGAVIQVEHDSVCIAVLLRLFLLTRSSSPLRGVSYRAVCSNDNRTSCTLSPVLLPAINLLLSASTRLSGGTGRRVQRLTIRDLQISDRYFITDQRSY
jgi:hypothetical protein